ncbi:MAG: DUF2029 domain-containing protein [Anaerolineae bacterium]|nr:DUF2029 domain-containing protein [Anaerolineae bacterium]
MHTHRFSTRYRTAILLLTLVLVTVVSIYAVRWAANNSLGSSDFNAYWAASRLLLLGRNPCDEQNMLEMEQAYFDPDRDWVMMVWNPPTLWVLLLPVAWMPYHVARVVWFITNVILLLVSCFLLQRVYFSTRPIQVLVLFCLVAALFSPVLISIIAGQVTFLVLFGLSACLFLISRDRWFLAGAALVLTTPKPHLVMLGLPYLLLFMAAKRKWRGWTGLASAGVFCVAVLFALRPEWAADDGAILNNPPTNWATPTLGGFLQTRGVGPWVKFAGLGLLALLPIFLYQPDRFAPESVTGLLTLVTIPVTFFGWSYDQSLLLLPIAQVFHWMSAPGTTRMERWVVAVLAVAALAASMAQRVLATSEVEYLWVPLAWAGIYALAWALNRQRQAKRTDSQIR